MPEVSQSLPGLTPIARGDGFQVPAFDGFGQDAGRDRVVVGDQDAGK